MNRRTLLSSALSLACTWKRAAAQQLPSMARIGWVTAQKEASLAPYITSFRSGLVERGYQEGRNIEIEYRFGDDALGRVPELVAELVRLPVNLLIAQGAAVNVVSKLAIPVPVVYAFSGDPVSAGFAESLAKPKGNMTGLTFMAPEMNAKRLELLKEIKPGLRKVALLANPEHPGEHIERAVSEGTARRLGLELVYFPTRNEAELEQAFKLMAGPQGPEAASVSADGFAIQNRVAIADFALSQRLPVISVWSVFAQSGLLCTYGPRLSESYRRLAYFVDRVLKGAKPADLPIEQPTVVELVLNLRTAAAIGVTVTPTLLARADEVIE